MKRMSGTHVRFFLPIFFIIILLLPVIASATPWTPDEWQNNGKLVDWVRDRNGNYVDDLIESQEGQVEVIIDLNKCYCCEDLDSFLLFLRSYGDVTYVGDYLSIICVSGIDPQEARVIGQRKEVAMVEMDTNLKWLDHDRQAMKVESSSEYKSENLGLAGWPNSLNGAGVNIAIVDSGVDNSIPELKNSYKFGYNAVNDVIEDPTDDVGHGTYMARFALGKGDSGIAPGAGLVDIKVGGASSKPTNEYVIRGFEKILENKKNWNIGIVSISFGNDIPNAKDDGKSAISQYVNLLVSNGMVVSASAGNGPTENDTYIKYPGDASHAITVGAADYKGTISRIDDVVSDLSTHGPRTDDKDSDALDELKPELVIHSPMTSPAAARTAGLTALILQKSPDITPGSIKDLLIRSAEDRDGTSMKIAYPGDTPTWDDAWGFGLIDAYQAVTQLGRKDADLTFIGFDDSPHPSQPWYYSAAIETESQRDGINPKEGVPDKIHARIVNKGPKTAKNVRVNVAFYPFSIGVTDNRFYDIESVIIPEIKPNDPPMNVSIDWTPPKRMVEQKHGCIRVTIDYGYDAEFGNMSNVAQKNVWITPTSSPAIFTFRVENPIPAKALIQLNVTSDSDDWNVSLSEAAFVLNPGDCARIITTRVDPPPGAKPGTRAIFFVSGTASPVRELIITAKPNEIPPEDIGGVALVANIPETSAPPTTTPLGTLGVIGAILLGVILGRRGK